MYISSLALFQGSDISESVHFVCKPDVTLCYTNGLEPLTHSFSATPEFDSTHPNYCNEDDATKGSTISPSRTDSTNKFDVMYCCKLGSSMAPVSNRATCATR